MTAGALALLILDDHGRPRARLAGPLDWREAMDALLRLDGRWIALDQRRVRGRALLPDRQDIALTRALHRRLRPMGMTLADHVIHDGEQHFSFRSAGLL